MIGLAMLSGCTAVSHPSALGTATPDSAVATAMPASSSSPASVPASPSASELPSSTTASTAGTPTSAAVVSPTASPTALSSNDIAGNVRATAQAFIDDFNIAFATGNVTAIEALTSPACGCRSLVNTIKQITAKNQRFVGVVLSLTSINVVSFVPAGASADMHYSISAGRVLDASGAQVDTSDPTPNGHAALFVLSVDGRWIVEQNTLLDVGAK
jgi:hypothetical protein